MRRVPGSDIFSVILYMSSEEEQSPIPQLLRIAQLGLRNSLVGLRNLACATSRIAQLSLRNVQDRATLLAQLPGLCNSACATTLAGLQLCNYTSSKQFHPAQNLKMTHAVPKSKTLSKFPPPCNFKLTWGLHKVKMI